MTRVQAPAKVNLALHVTGRRADGYHEIETLVAFAAFGDTVTAEPWDGIDLVLDGPFADALRNGPANLVLKAAQALVTLAPAGVGARLHLTKNLPVASGIGGGSADAAATLIALRRCWRLPVATNLHGIAEKLGADVPMCLDSRPLIARGAGERIEPIGLPADLPCVLVNPGVALSTREVFAALDRRDNSGLERFPPAGVDLDWLRRQRNDLEEPAASLCPAIGEVLDVLSGCAGNQIARMSGSGATCFGLFASDREAGAAAARIAALRPGWWCIATRLLAGEHPSRIVEGGGEPWA